MSTRIIAWKTRVPVELDGIEGQFELDVKRLSTADREELRELVRPLQEGTVPDDANRPRYDAMLQQMVVGVSGIEFVWDEHGAEVTAPTNLSQLLDCCDRAYEGGSEAVWWGLFSAAASEQFASGELRRLSSLRLAGRTGSRAYPPEPNGGNTPTADPAEPQG